MLAVDPCLTICLFVSCRGCDSPFHIRTQYLGTLLKDIGVFFCSTCKPVSLEAPEIPEASETLSEFCKGDLGYQCEECSQTCIFEYNLQRHVARKHPTLHKSVETTVDVVQIKKSELLEDVLKDVGLNEYIYLFQEQCINLEMLLGLQPDEFT